MRSDISTMRICIINWRDMRHPWAGGSEVHLRAFARELVARGHLVTLLCGGHPSLPREEMIEGVRILRVGGTYSIYLLAPFAYFRHCKKETDLVLEDAHGLPFFAPLFAARPVICFIHHIHATLFRTELPFIIGFLCSMMERFIVPFFYRRIPTLTISRGCATVLKRWGYRNIRTITPGIEPMYMQQRADETNKPVILAVSRLRRYKRIDVLIRMMPHIRMQIAGASLVIAGDGPERPTLARMISDLHLEHCVSIRGFVHDEEKLRLYRTARVFAFPSEMEGWGMVATEAAAAGLPTVAFRVPGIEEAVSDGVSGILVATSDAFEKALIEMLADDALFERLSRGARTWSQLHSWKKAGEELEAWMKELTAGA